MRQLEFRSVRAVAAVLLLLTCLVSVPRSGSAQDPAAAFISNLGAQAIQVLGPSVPPAQRTAVFRQLFGSHFDLPEIARFALGPHARTISPAQQQEFEALLREYLVRAYATRLAPYAGYPFQVIGSRPHGGGTMVASRVIRSSGTMSIDWVVVNRGGRLLVSDVLVDGVSMKVTHRNEFASIIQRNGGQVEALLAALRQQLAMAR
jgi:phospholipid transport system substrate-binding protein